MKPVNQSMTALAVMIAAVAIAPAVRAAEYSAASVLHGNSWHCGHVIDLLHRYGDKDSTTAHTVMGVLHTGGHGISTIVSPKLGDLELVGVALGSECTNACGPIYHVTLTNHCERDLCDFRISVVAVLGRIHPTCPTTTIKVDKICAGATVEFQLQLPIESHAMGIAGREALAFKTLVVAIDSYDELVECNESNNIAIFDRCKIPVVQTATVVETEVAPAEQPAPPQVDSVLTPESAKPESTSPLDGIDLDSFDLDEADATAVRIR